MWRKWRNYLPKVMWWRSPPEIEAISAYVLFAGGRLNGLVPVAQFGAGFVLVARLYRRLIEMFEVIPPVQIGAPDNSFYRAMTPRLRVCLFRTRLVSTRSERIAHTNRLDAGATAATANRRQMQHRKEM